MAHHSSTPQSVLDAPSRTVVHTHVPQGATRQERRHGYVAPADLGVVELAAYAARIGRARNAPAVRQAARRGRRVTRGGAR
jgi:hypothetical protein